MKRTIKLVVTALLLSLAIGCAWFLGKLHRDYTRMINEAPKPFVIAVETVRLKTLREEIAADQWRVVGREVSAYDKMLDAIGFAPGIEGIAQLLSHPLPPFDWFDMDQNKRNVVIAMLRSLHSPHASERVFHLNNSRQAGVIFLEENVVEFHVNTKAGLFSGTLVKRPAGNEEHPGLSKDYPDL
jgi:hypothetical protein